MHGTGHGTTSSKSWMHHLTARERSTRSDGRHRAQMRPHLLDQRANSESRYTSPSPTAVVGTSSLPGAGRCGLLGTAGESVH